jgi:hypothetical protein
MYNCSGEKIYFIAPDAGILEEVSPEKITKRCMVSR